MMRTNDAPMMRTTDRWLSMPTGTSGTLLECRSMREEEAVDVGQRARSNHFNRRVSSMHLIQTAVRSHFAGFQLVSQSNTARAATFTDLQSEIG
jgi:hypothetical protein